MQPTTLLGRHESRCWPTTPVWSAKIKMLLQRFVDKMDGERSAT
jgi:hypothetical protein